MRNRERVLELIRSESTGLTDLEIHQRTGIRPIQQVNQICRRLADEELIERHPVSQGRIIDLPTDMNLGPTSIRRSTIGKEQKNPSPIQSYSTIANKDLTSDFSRALFVLPCSRKKRQISAHCTTSNSILRSLPLELANELAACRTTIARQVGIEESDGRLPAVERYDGHFYRAAGDAFDTLAKQGANFLIISGAYGVVLPGELIALYDQQFKKAMWPNDIVARCIAAYAEAVSVDTVVGLLSATTEYAKVFRSVRWPDQVERATLLSPDRRAGQVKGPQALGEALKAYSECTQPSKRDWTSSKDIGLTIEECHSIE